MSKNSEKIARKKGQEILINKRHGKGSHYKITIGGKSTILKKGEMNPHYIKIVKKQLGL